MFTLFCQHISQVWSIHFLCRFSGGNMLIHSPFGLQACAFFGKGWKHLKTHSSTQTVNSRGPLPTHEWSFTQKLVLAKNSDQKEWFFMLPIWVTNFLETSSLLKITYVSALRKILKQGVNLTFQQSLPQIHSKEHPHTTKNHPQFFLGSIWKLPQIHQKSSSPFIICHVGCLARVIFGGRQLPGAHIAVQLAKVNTSRGELVFTWCKNWCKDENRIPPGSLTVRHWKHTIPKGKDRLPTIIFSGANC